MNSTLLKFLYNYLNDMHIQSLVTTGYDFDLSKLDMGLRNTIFAYSEEKSNNRITEIEANTIYHITDYYDCNYTFFYLPETDNYLFIGPYLYKAINDQDIIALMNNLHIPAELFSQLKDYYFALPYVLDRHSFQLVLHHAYSNICHNDKINSLYLDLKNLESEDEYRELHQFIIPNDPILSMQLLEKRYTFEDLLLEAVTNGNTYKALSIIDNMVSSHLVPLEYSTIPEYKNILISFNTLIRRSIYLAGIHPFYIDRIYNALNNEINTMQNETDIVNININIIKSYCNLINTHSTSTYSESIRYILAAIEASLTSDLSLKRFAKELFLNTSYLSTLFKKEVGMTLTEYVNKSRIEYAKKLLKSTSLSIQNIANQSGISDIHYFTRLFTRETGMSPRVWRNS